MAVFSADNIFTYKFTGATVTITQAMGLMKLSIYCKSTSTAVGVITGTMQVGAFASNAIDLEAGQQLTLLESANNPIGNLTIQAPAGCTIQLVGEKR